MKKTILLSILIIASFLLFQITPILESGYQLYHKAITDNPLDEVVSELRAKESYIPLDEVSDEYIDALVLSEDKRFFSHPGVDFIALSRAVFKNLLAGRYKEGGSTITQQLAKNLYFSFEKRMERKVAELFVVSELEENYTKDDIIEIYINIIYFGEGCYGIKEAALHYFDKLPHQLNKDEINSLVYTIKSPNNYNPNKLKLSFSAN